MHEQDKQMCKGANKHLKITQDGISKKGNKHKGGKACYHTQG